MFGSCGRMLVGSLNITHGVNGCMAEGIMAGDGIRETDGLGVTAPAGGPPRLESALLRGFGFSHGFFTRAGGVSAPPFDSLNPSVSTGDDAALVRENRVRVMRALGVSERSGSGAQPGALYYLSQVH